MAEKKPASQKKKPETKIKPKTASKSAEKSAVSKKKLKNSPQNNENWKYIACPGCQNKDKNQFEFKTANEWHFRCAVCPQEWIQNIETGEAEKLSPKAAKTRKTTAQPNKKPRARAAKPEEILEAARAKVRAKRAKVKDQPAAEETPAEPPKSPHATRPTPDEEALIIQRQNLVYEWKKAKYTYREISKLLSEYKDRETGELLFANVGTSVAQVHADYHFMLDLNRKEQELTVQNDIQEEIDILNEVHREFYPILKRPAVNVQIPGRILRDEAKRDAADVIIMCVEKRAKLKNLYKPIEVNLNTGEKLAALLGLSAEELPDADEDSAGG